MDLDLTSAITSIQPRGDNHWIAVASFRQGMPAFAGHFPEHPILPGVFHLELVRCMCEQINRQRYRIGQVNAAKFIRAALPDQVLEAELSLERLAEGLRVQADICVSKIPFAKLSLMLVALPVVQSLG